ncbi:MAG: YerC/YecD family TrpR-related protein [Candidatus Levyibacteriota bacterium]
MSQISKYPISKEIADRIFEVFLKTFVRIRDREEADQFISDLLTPTEKVMLAKRLAIAFLLEKGHDYRTIQEIIRVSAPTIASVNLARQYGSEGYKKLISKILKEEKLDEFLDSVVSKLLSIPSPKGKGTGAWRYLKQELDKNVKKKKRAF